MNAEGRTPDDWIDGFKTKWAEAYTDGPRLPPTAEQLLDGADCPYAADPAFRDRLEALAALWASEFASRAGAPSSHVSGRAGPVDVALPERIGRYTVLGIAGRGGMGVVYRARDVALGRDVAVKTLRDGAFADAARRGRLGVEGKSVAALDHPNIVKVLDAGGADGAVAPPYLVLELVDGPSLEEFSRGRRWTAEDAAQLAAILADAIDHAHDNGVLHRDLTPGNVLLAFPPGECDRERSLPLDARRAVPKITDFGIGKRVGEPDALTRTGELLGTLSFAPPEFITGDAREADRSSDVYGLGAVLFWLLTGRPPREGATAQKVIENELRDPEHRPPWPRPARRNVHPDLIAVCDKCLAGSREARYATAAELARDLRAFLAGEPTAARPPSLRSRVTGAFAYSPRLARLRIWKSMIVGVAALGFVENAAVFAMQRYRAPGWLFAVNSGLVVLTFAAFFYVGWRKTRPRGEGREILLIVGGASMSSAFITVLCGVFFVPNWREDNLGWAFGCVCNAQAASVIAYRFKQFYETPFLFCVLAVVTAADPDRAPLWFAVGWLAIMLLAGLQVREDDPPRQPERPGK